MHSFSEYIYLSSPEPQISKFFESAGPVLEARLTLENFEFEINAISNFEQSIPESFNLHLDMILTGGAAMVSQYYQELAGGKAKMLERLKNKLGEEKFQKVNEALNELRTLLKENHKQLNEQEDLDFQKKIGDIMTDSAIDKAIEGAPDTEPKSGILGTIKTIWNTLTDDGDPISILQLVLDLAGLIPGPWGVAADLVNALIYALRKKYLLAGISVVAAVLPYAGDAIKALKLGKSAKYADDFFQYIVETPAPNVKRYFERIPSQHQGPVIKLFKILGDKMTSALAKGGTILADFTKTLEKYTGAFPKVQSFFKSLGTRFEKFAAKMGKAADDLKLLPATPLAGSGKVFADLTKVLSPELGKVGGKLSLDRARGMIKLTNAEGKIVREFSESALSDPKLWINNPSIQGFLSVGGKSTDDVIKYFNTLPKVAAKAESTAQKAWSVIHKGLRAKAALMAFIGKMIIKASTGKTAEELGVPESVVEYTGTDAYSQAIKKKQDEARARGVQYSPFVEFNAEDEEDRETLTDYQNYWAKKIDMPQLISKAYDEYGDPIMAKEYKDFWKEEDKPMGKGEVAKANKDFWKSVASGEITKDATGKLTQTAPTQSTAAKSLLQVPDLKSKSWYQEVFPAASNESVDLLSFDKFVKHKK